jgi:hypothetical protein
MTKPWGFMGEKLAEAPTLRVRYRPEGLLKQLTGTEVFPEIKLPGVTPENLGLSCEESNGTNGVPWYIRYFLQ